ncbi:MAG: hypothetical protein BMS9Abin01_2227 [Gammaproteobacteria bacterium]|nr:MAG: hypothetical protein BMS9Abin01_2227 [Gammaproteobacteria bacterium]
MMSAVRKAARIVAIVGIVGIAGAIAACPGAPRDIELARQCKSGLKVAYEELDFAKADGFSGTVNWTKAASLLSAASIQQEFGKYPNCVDKVRRARYYIEQSKH